MAKVGRPPGTPKTGGRKKGTPNKVNAELKDLILGALHKADKAGGEAYLIQQAKDNPTAFLSLVGKVLPMTVAGDKDNPLKTVVEISWGMSKE